MQSKNWIQLGRIGDILNILPLVQQYQGVRFITNYPEILLPTNILAVNCPVHTLADARKWTEDNYSGKIIISQVDQNPLANKDGESYAKESWRLAGSKYQDIELQYNEDWIEDIDLSGDIIYNGLSYSSPFYNNQLVKKLGNIINITGKRVSNIWHLLSLYGKCKILVTVDTATLHLAWAKIPKRYQKYGERIKVIALQRGGWYSTPERSNWIGKFTYDNYNGIVELIERNL